MSSVLKKSWVPVLAFSIILQSVSAFAGVLDDAESLKHGLEQRSAIGQLVEALSPTQTRESHSYRVSLTSDEIQRMDWNEFQKFQAQSRRSYQELQAPPSHTLTIGGSLYAIGHISGEYYKYEERSSRAHRRSFKNIIEVIQKGDFRSIQVVLPETKMAHQLPQDFPQLVGQDSFGILIEIPDGYTSNDDYGYGSYGNGYVFLTFRKLR